MTRNANDIIRSMHDQMRQHTFVDPLLKRGILREWVCVVNPALVRPLLHDFDKMPIERRYRFEGEQAQLAVLTGRRTYIIPHAPTDAIEYMPEAEMYRRYADYFKSDAAPGTAREPGGCDG